MNTKKRLAVLGALVFGFIATTASSCEHKPKERFINHVEAMCGPEVAARYAQVPFVDRDYAGDSVLVSCILFPEIRDGWAADQAKG